MRPNRGKRRRVAMVLLTSSAIGWSAQAAHAWHNWQSIHVHDGSVLRVYVDTGTISSDKRNRIWRAAYSTDYSWGRWTPTYKSFQWGGPAAYTVGSLGFFREDYLPAMEECPSCITAAVTERYAAGHVLVGLNTIMNSALNWYTGTGDAPSSQIDYWSVASHELGHWLGLGDLITGVDAECPDNIGDSTMCSYNQAGGLERYRQPDTSEDAASVGVAADACRAEGAVCEGELGRLGREVETQLGQGRH